ncbi:MAG TPA: hypothetical protein DEE98_07060 [Elusimicrobia bacterium]|nr:hypothetical protein [Elusimicrobiota bacterium]
MISKVQINLKPSFRDRHGEHISHEIAEMNLKSRPHVKYHPVYRIEGELGKSELNDIAAKLLIDPVTENYSLAPLKKAGTVEVEVWLKKGVTDTVSDSVVKAVRDLGIVKPVKVNTGHKYILAGKVDKKSAAEIAQKLLANPIIQEYSID